MKSKKKNTHAVYWKIRSRRYNKLKWVHSDVYLDAFVKAGRFTRRDVVLDVGTGTGVVAHRISPHVGQVIGLDKSQDMLKHCNWKGNMYFVRRNLFDVIFADNVFDKITCRQMFHHILTNRQKAMDMCYRMLKKGGMMVFSEGIPPSRRVRNDYIKIFRLKEKRVTFFEEDLAGLMKKSGFKHISTAIVYLRQMSIKNWLINSGLSQKIQRKIYLLHADAGDYFKKDYNMTLKNNDCYIDMKMAIVTGIK